MTAWQYEVSTARYRGEGGRFVSRQTMTAIRDTFAERVKGEIQKVADAHNSGRLSASEWETAMRGQIKQAHLAAYTLGRGGAAQMTARDYGKVGQALRVEYKALADFKAVLPEMTPQAIATRSSLYAETAIGGYERGRVEGLAKAGVDTAIWRTVDSPCDECAPLDGTTVDLADGDLPPLHVRCRCYLEPVA